MNETLRNVFALLVGIVAGGLVNMGLVMVGPHVIAPPVGVYRGADSLAGKCCCTPDFPTASKPPGLISCLAEARYRYASIAPTEG